jgi:hypothetical protein
MLHSRRATSADSRLSHSWIRGELACKHKPKRSSGILRDGENFLCVAVDKPTPRDVRRSSVDEKEAAYLKRAEREIASAVSSRVAPPR